MKTDCSPFGNLEKQDKNYLLSATFGWIAGVLHIPNNNKNRTFRADQLTMDPNHSLELNQFRKPRRSFYSSQGMKLLVFLGLLFFSISVFAQTYNVGDYRSITDGNWTDASTWEVFDGTNWNPAVNYPGELVGNFDYNVYIQPGDTVDLLDTAGNLIPGHFNALIVGDSSGPAPPTATLNLLGDATLHMDFWFVTSNGLGYWEGNPAELFLDAEILILIENGGNLDGKPPLCSGSRHITIGGEQYAVCNENAQNDPITFAELVFNGGNLYLNPTSSLPVCEGVDFTLFTNPSPSQTGRLEVGFK